MSLLSFIVELSVVEKANEFTYLYVVTACVKVMTLEKWKYGCANKFDEFLYGGRRGGDVRGGSKSFSYIFGL